jgi:hexosaminidase
VNIINQIYIIPEPVSIRINSEKFNITETTSIFSDPKLDVVSKYLKNLIQSVTSFQLGIKDLNQLTEDNDLIILKLIDEDIQIGEEGYYIEITSQKTMVSANTALGVFYGIQTLRQLLPPSIESNTRFIDGTWELPCLEIVDFPRFSWRGYMLDEARHFHGKSVVKKLLDICALLKINVFHWHLSDDQGFRIEVKKYPRLTEIGSKRNETQVGGFLSRKRDGIPHSGFYTQEDIAEIVAYAKERFITIVPEIEIPGHTRAILAAYPELSCKGVSFEVSSHWGIHKDVLCVGKEKVFEFLRNLMDELITIFPSRIIHIGGDEVLKTRWKECQDCQARLKSEGLKDVKDLHVYFTNRILNYLNSRHIRVIGWNDVLNKNLKEKIICQYWIRKKHLVLEHLRNGGQAIMSNFKYVYLDHSYSFTPLNLAYEFEPIPNKLENQHHKNVLGMEALIWGEFTPNLRRIEWQTFPRLIAFAEVSWTQKDKKNFVRFQDKLRSFNKHLDIMNINYANEDEFQPGSVKKMFSVFSLLKEGKGGE